MNPWPDEPHEGILPPPKNRRMSGLDLVGEYLKGDDAAVVLWPLPWRGEGLDDDELGPASTARPWVMHEAAVVKKPRASRLGLLLGMMVLALTGPDRDPAPEGGA